MKHTDTFFIYPKFVIIQIETRQSVKGNVQLWNEIDLDSNSNSTTVFTALGN